MNKSIKVVLIVVLVSVLSLSALTSTSYSASSIGIPWMNGANYWPLGVNYAWETWGNDFSDNGWASHLEVLKSKLDDMKAQGSNAVRWWMFCDSYAAPLFSSSDESGLCTGLPPKWIDHMVEITDYAKSKNMKIYWTITSFDVAKNGRAWDHDSIIDNSTVRKSFIDNCVKPIAQALGNNEGVMGWDVCNEPEWMISKADGGEPNAELETFSLATVRTFVKEVTTCLHTYAKQPVSIGSASMKWIGAQYNFWQGLGLDFYDFHWYDWATPYFNPMTKTAASLGLDKPIMIGEMMPDVQGSSLKTNHQTVLEAILKNGYCGYLMWSWTDTSGYNCVGKTKPDYANFKAAHPELNFIVSSVSPSPTSTPTNTSQGVKEDINKDGVVNMADVIKIANVFNSVRGESKYDANCDLNDDGAINMSDVIKIAAKFNQTV
ncbi:MAG: cellulase family glycosylhydrolase [Bacillota bacterium]|nr:cellulase family glycosylhydrolase [Bacillota bacterium]